MGGGINMLIMTIILLFCLLFFAYRILNRDILSPSMISIVMFIVGCFAGLIGNRNWMIEINVLIPLIYFLALLFMVLGEKICLKKRVVFKNNFLNKKNVSDFTNSLVQIPIWFYIAYFIYSIFVLSLMQKRAVAAAVVHGYSYQKWQNLSEYIKDAFMYGEASWGMALATLYAILVVIAYISFAAVLINYSVLGWRVTIKKYKRYIFAIVPYVIAQIIQGQRSGYVGFITFGIMIYYLYCIKEKKEIKLSNILRKGIVIFVLACIIFISSGVFTGRLNIKNANESLLVYLGSSVVDFSNMLNYPIKGLGLGFNSFTGLLSTLRRIFIYIPTSTKQMFTGGFVTMANGSRSNIYSALANYYLDFGFIGIIIITLLLGMIYRLLYNNAKKSNGNIWPIYLYAYVSYGIVMAFISEQQLTLLFSIGQLMHLIIAYFALKLVKKYCCMKLVNL